MLTEKYRPERIAHIVGQDHIKPKLEEYVRRDEIPHLLFSGDPGLGKTTSAIALAKELYGDEWANYFLELNASDERGIDVVRDRIKEFARSGFDERDRIIFLDESDSLTSDAQAALRRTIEANSENCKFILSCNYSSDIIPAIQSRCTLFEFQPVPADQLKEHISNMAEAEEIDITDEAVHQIVKYSRGDVRKAIVALDGLHIKGEQIESEDVTSVLPIADEDDVLKLLNLCSVGKFNAALEFVDELMTSKGVTSRNIIREISDVVWETSMGDREKVHILELAGRTEFYINQGGTPKVQIASLLGAIVQEAS